MVSYQACGWIQIQNLPLFNVSLNPVQSYYDALLSDMVLWSRWMEHAGVRICAAAACSHWCDASKWDVLWNPGINEEEVRNWITASIDYCSHHRPSERPGQEMHPPLCGLLGVEAPLYCLQAGRLAVSNGFYFVNGATVTCLGSAISCDYLIRGVLFPGIHI